MSSDVLGATTRDVRPTRYGTAVPILMVAAFSLSVVHTVYAELSGLEDPDFTVTSPMTWAFYGVAFAMARLAAVESRPAQLAVLGYLTVILGVSVFYYPTTFTPEQQTTFAWFENDVYTGLLLMALCLSVLRRGRRSLVP